MPNRDRPMFVASTCVVVLSGFGSVARAQKVITIDDRIACSRCRIVLDTVAKIGTSHGLEMFAANRRMS